MSSMDWRQAVCDYLEAMRGDFEGFQDGEFAEYDNYIFGMCAVAYTVGRQFDVASHGFDSHAPNYGAEIYKQSFVQLG